ncbi:hypothetical protein DAI22_10g150801 [Oryza sativa Japonica Group]|nr:hypothetical protein DAI22_10g150801 [Oryza sativa Japonica Group]
MLDTVLVTQLHRKPSRSLPSCLAPLAATLVAVAANNMRDSSGKYQVLALIGGAMAVTAAVVASVMTSYRGRAWGSRSCPPPPPCLCCSAHRPSRRWSLEQLVVAVEDDDGEGDGTSTSVQVIFFLLLPPPFFCSGDTRFLRCVLHLAVGVLSASSRRHLPGARRHSPLLHPPPLSPPVTPRHRGAVAPCPCSGHRRLAPLACSGHRPSSSAPPVASTPLNQSTLLCPGGREGISSSDFSPHDGREQSRSSSRPRSIEPSAQKAHGRVVSLGQGRPNKPRPRLAAAIAQPCSYSSSGRRHRRHSCPPRRPRSRRRARPPRRPRSHRRAAVLS